MTEGMVPACLWVVLAVGCATGLQLPPGGVQARLLTPDDPAGFRSLAVEHSDFEHIDSVAAARDPGELRRLWRWMALDGDPPAVDFATHVVIAFKHHDDGCLDELSALALTADGRLIPELSTAADTCELPLLSTVHVAAVARVALPPQGFVLEWHRDPQEPPTRQVVRLPGRPAPPPAPVPAPRVGLTGPTAGTVELPPPGECRRAALDDGTEVHVVHHRDGSASVLAADRPVALFGMEGLRQVVDWSTRYRRFDAAYDEYGTSVFRPGREALDRYEIEPLPGLPARLRVGRRMRGVPRGTVAPMGRAGSDSPDRDREREPTQARRSPEEAARLPDGSLALIGAELVVGGGEPPTLCVQDQRQQAGPRLCPPGSPRPVGVSDPGYRTLLLVIHGPMRARVRGHQLTELTLQGGGYSMENLDVGERVGVGAFSRLGWDTGVGLSAVASARRQIVGGGDIRTGPRWGLRPLAVRSAAYDALLGDHLGVDLKLRILSGRARGGDLGTVVTAGTGVWLANQVGAWRLPSLAGLLLPEGGVVVGSGGPAGWYLGLTTPIARGVSGPAQFAVELVPTALVTWRGAGREALLGLGLRGTAGMW